MALLTATLLEETDTQLTIKFTSNGGRELTKTFNKPLETTLTTEELVDRYRRRMTMDYLKTPFKFKRPVV
jgi:hypothetical protein